MVNTLVILGWFYVSEGYEKSHELTEQGPRLQSHGASVDVLYELAENVWLELFDH